MRIDQSVALVTGGASGLGAAVVGYLLSKGGQVAVIDSEEVVDDPGPDSVLRLRVDVRDDDQVVAAVTEVAERFGRIDILLSAAGVNPGGNRLATSASAGAVADLVDALAVNVVGAFTVIRAVVDVMASRPPNADGERGVLVNVASIAGMEGQAGQVAYAASKAALAGMTLPLARELADIGVRVVCIAPGIMDTPMFAALGPEIRGMLASMEVFPRRPGAPEEFAALVGAIVENPMLNGEVIRLDGAMRLAHWLGTERKK